MNQPKMREGKIYDEKEGKWNVNIGDIIFFDKELWIVKSKEKTILHDHPYIDIITYRERWDGKPIGMKARIYSHEAEQIKLYWKAEKIK